MPENSEWYKSVWKVIVVLSTISGLIASILQISGAVDFWGLLALPLYNFLIFSVPVYYVVLLIMAFIVLYYSMVRFRAHRSNILDFEDARRIAKLCQTPRTTEYLRQQYEYWESQSPVVAIPGYGFDDYMKRLEKEGYLIYQDGKWVVTQKALDYIKKYHGD